MIDFSGSIVLISHDIDFLKPIANKTVEIKNRTATFFEGGIEYFLYKKSLNENATNQNNIQPDKTSSENKKLQKKREAELRQKIYSSTKELKEKIKLIERR
jgi:ATP-binding cassette subfamily F protein 3